ncbi:MAG: glycoside hydrolase family 2 protein [Bryobacteraceae bacterium]
MQPSAAIVLAALLAASAGPARSQQVELIQNVSARAGQSLDGPWQFLMDPYDAGYVDFHLNPLKDGGLGAGREPGGIGDKFELGFLPATPTLQAPGDWNTQRPELLWYEGILWYRRDFTWSPRPGHRQFLWFGAANYQAVVFLNGEKLGQHEGGFTPFQFEVTGKLKPGHNAVIVRVDDSRHPDAIPPTMTDWFNYGGLTRDVRLLEVPETFVEDYFVQLEKGSQRRVAGWVRLNGPHARQKVAIRIPEAGASVEAETDANGMARFSFDATLSLWSPDNPKLYEVTVEAETDRVGDQIGFRGIAVSGARILLNGKPLFLRGVAIHAEAPVRSGRVYSEADARTLLDWAKDLGCNYVRLAHYPHDEAMTRLADRMGLLVWSEVPVYWAVEWENPVAYAKAERMLTEMITRDKNRASIALWSVANETPLGDARTKFLAGLAAKARELDSTRLVTAATLPHTSGDTTTIEDPLGQYLDVLGLNEYVGWYDGGPDKIDRMTYTTRYDKPLIMSEFGAAAVFGAHGGENTPWTEEYQANVYRRQVAMFGRIPFLAGTSAWILMDFRCPRRFLSGIQDYYNRKGLLSDRGEKKQAFHVLRDFYLEKAKK